MCNGVEFQTADSHTMKARLLIDVQVCGCVRRHLSDDLTNTEKHAVSKGFEICELVFGHKFESE